jgi:hypothetical protein
MFTHKPRISEDIPDFKGFMLFLKKQNPELHDRYMVQVKRATIADITMTSFTILAVVMAILALAAMLMTSIFSTEMGVELAVFIGGLAGMIVFSIMGRKAHTEAIRIESEIVVEYHRSGFKEQ